MSEAVKKNSRSASAVVPRLFFPELQRRLHSLHENRWFRPQDHLVSDCHLPDGIVVDAAGGSIWTGPTWASQA